MSDLREKLQSSDLAVAEVLSGPESGWQEGISSAEWLRRSLLRSKKLHLALEAMAEAMTALAAEKARADKNAEMARAAIIEDAARGDIP